MITQIKGFLMAIEIFGLNHKKINIHQGNLSKLVQLR
jgi:hypothetical protein